MQIFNRRKKLPPRKGRGPTRWTVWELILIVLSTLMIIFPLYAEIGRWMNPSAVPAQEQTTEPLPEEPVEPQPAEEPPTEAPEPQPTEAPTEAPAEVPEQPTEPIVQAPTAEEPEQPAEAPTEAPEPAEPAQRPTPVDTDTPPPDATDTPTPTPTADETDATPTPTSGGEPQSTPTPRDTSTPTNTPIPTTPNLTPRPTNTPGGPLVLSVSKTSNKGAVAVGEQLTFNITVNSSSATEHTVTLEDAISENLQVLSAVANRGSCAVGQTVNCSLSVWDGASASVIITVLVASSPKTGSIVNHASVNGGAAGDSVSVLVREDLPTATNAPPPTDMPVTPTPVGPTPTWTVVPGATATPTLVPRPTLFPEETEVTDKTDTPERPTVKPTATEEDVEPTATEEDVEPTATEEEEEEDSDDTDDGEQTRDDRKTSETPPIPPPPPPTEGPFQPASPTPPPPPPFPFPSPTQVIGFVQPTPRPVWQPTAPPAVVGTQVREQEPVGPEEERIVPTREPTDTPIPEPIEPPTSTPVESGINFRLMSDWGSAFPGKEVEYTLVLHNDRPVTGASSGDLQDIVIHSTFPSNLELSGSQSDRGQDPTITGNDLQFKLDSLKPGELVELTIKTKIKPDVPSGTLLVSQAQVEYESLKRPFYSNIVTLQVLGPGQQVTPTDSPTPQTRTPQATNTATAQTTGTPKTTRTTQAARTAQATGTAAMQAATATSEAASDATSSPVQVAEGSGGVTSSPVANVDMPRRNTIDSLSLPSTSTGVPLAGFALLGVTLMIRTVRIHRGRERI